MFPDTFTIHVRYTYDTMCRVYVYTPVGICVHEASWNPWKRGSGETDPAPHNATTKQSPPTISIYAYGSRYMVQAVIIPQ